MRAYELLTEKELEEYQIIDRMLHGRELSMAERLFDRMVNQGTDELEAFHQAAQMANVREKPFQQYLQSHDKFSS